MLHEVHQNFLVLDHQPAARTSAREARGRRITLRQRLRGLLRPPAFRVPLGAHHA
jgi:hypothetical protein